MKSGPVLAQKTLDKTISNYGVRLAAARAAQDSILSGSPEPAVYMYTVLYQIAKYSSSLGGHLFIACAGWPSK
ncbi:hypothetical protein DCAR_0933397 [Daucus carota subsp. sativus]|uniref:Uncharacterized protein n=1 Tax=Daucus carota subsp. sativus TaxID=79200 RepID=A0A175YDD1_DAUCS|nr:hypothetical protein DCAR_0933397 [Daucus carota subsp. sativus]